jgi:hypothetical protein
MFTSPYQSSGGIELTVCHDEFTTDSLRAAARAHPVNDRAAARVMLDDPVLVLLEYKKRNELFVRCERPVLSDESTEPCLGSCSSHGEGSLCCNDKIAYARTNAVVNLGPEPSCRDGVVPAQDPRSVTEEILPSIEHVIRCARFRVDVSSACLAAQHPNPLPE